MKNSVSKSGFGLLFGTALVMVIGLMIPHEALAWWVRYPFGVSFGLAGRDLNGIDLNGKNLEGRYVTGVSLDGVTVNGRQVKSLRLRGTRFLGIGKGTLEGGAAIFQATLDDGSIINLRVDESTRPRDREDKELILYLASYETVDGWEPLCGYDDSGEPVAAIPLLGRWDYSQGTETGGSKIDDDRSFTFACDGYVLHKCVDAGYKPWKSVTVCEKDKSMQCEEVSLADHHQTCTRMMRADFCGDGTSYTQNSVVVSMYDGYGIRTDTEDWEIEAEWDADGAICIQADRVDGLTPECRQYLIENECGDPSHFSDGSLLISELP